MFNSTPPEIMIQEIQIADQKFTKALINVGLENYKKDLESNPNFKKAMAECMENMTTPDINVIATFVADWEDIGLMLELDNDLTVALIESSTGIKMEDGDKYWDVCNAVCDEFMKAIYNYHQEHPLNVAPEHEIVFTESELQKVYEALDHMLVNSDTEEEAFLIAGIQNSIYEQTRK